MDDHGNSENGERWLTLRAAELNTTIEAVAKKLGLADGSAISHWDRHKRPIPMKYVERLADELNVTVADIFERYRVFTTSQPITIRVRPGRPKKEVVIERQLNAEAVGSCADETCDCIRFKCLVCGGFWTTADEVLHTH